MVASKAKRVAMPRIGCRKGQLQWGTVKKMVETAFRDTDITVAVYGAKNPKPKAVSTKTAAAEAAPNKKWSAVVGRKKRKGEEERGM